MSFLKRLKSIYVLKRHALNFKEWERSLTNVKITQRLNAVEKAHLRELVTLFLFEKSFIGVRVEITDRMRSLIAIQACLPALHIGYSVLEGWREVVVYPAAFRVARDEKDAAGVVHHAHRILLGEAWYQGPVVLSWADVEYDLEYPTDGHNVVIHEIAHKLDMLNGRTNGMPPLHPAMSRQEWTNSLTLAYRQLRDDLQHHHKQQINVYAASTPAEFFAVLSELFFTQGHLLHQLYPFVYRQFSLYYRQDPLGKTFNH
jgi:MtfA peptidase